MMVPCTMVVGTPLGTVELFSISCNTILFHTCALFEMSFKLRSALPEVQCQELQYQEVKCQEVQFQEAQFQEQSLWHVVDKIRIANDFLWDCSHIYLIYLVLITSMWVVIVKSALSKIAHQQVSRNCLRLCWYNYYKAINSTKLVVAFKLDTNIKSKLKGSHQYIILST